MEEKLPDYDESLRPAWEGPSASAPQWGAGEELVRIHDHLRAEADSLLGAIDDHIAGREPIAAARSILHQLSARQSYSAVGSLCSGFCTLLTMHHSIEDRAVFPGLGRDEPGAVPVLRRLMEEHEVIAEIIALLYRVLDAVEANRSHAGELKRVAEHLSDRLASHLRYEEAQLVGALNLHGY